MKSLSILVADDEADIRQLVQHWMIEAGHSVTCVSNGTEAAKLLKLYRFDLVVTDVLMPDGDGLQLIDEFKKAQPTTRILAISGGGRYVEGDDCLKIAKGFGAHAAVMKPFSREQFLGGVVDAMRKASS